MTKSRSVFMNPNLYGMALLTYLMLLYGCTKEKPLPTSDRDSNNNTTAMAPTADTNLLVPMDVGPVAQMLMADGRATITWNWLDWIFGNIAINRDSVEYYANRPDIDIVTLMPDTLSEQSNHITSLMYTPYHFHCARDTIQKYWDYLEQHGKYVNAGNATINVNKYNGAQLPNVYEMTGYVPYGMSEEDSTWYTDKGYRVMRDYSINYKSGDTNAQHKYKSQIDTRERTALYKDQMRKFEDSAKFNRPNPNRRQGR